MGIKHRSQRLHEDQSGIAAIEFGLIGGIFITLLLAGFDMGHSMYMNSVLEGALQKAARNSALQSGSTVANQAALDTAVRTQVQRLNKTATVTFSRRFYKNFDAANNRRHEVDIHSGNPSKNNDGICETGVETYLDVNNNAAYDADGGDQGQGGAQDAVIYRVTVTYPRLFPMAGLLGWSERVSVDASTVIQNQPYSAQSQYGAATARAC